MQISKSLTFMTSWLGKILFIQLIFLALNINCDDFWVGVKISPAQINFSNIQNRLKNDFNKILNNLTVRKKFPIRPKTVSNWGFAPTTHIHITLAEGSLKTNADKRAIHNILKSINFKRIKNIRFKNRISIFGINQNFIVFEIDPNQNKDLYRLVKTIEARISRISKNIQLKKYTPIKLHISLGTIYPPFARLKGNYFKNTRNQILKLAATTNPQNANKFPHLSRSLKKYVLRDFSFVVTPCQTFLTLAQKNHPQYTYCKYKLK